MKQTILIQRHDGGASGLAHILGTVERTVRHRMTWVVRGPETINGGISSTVPAKQRPLLTVSINGTDYVPRRHPDGLLGCEWSVTLPRHAEKPRDLDGRLGTARLRAPRPAFS